MVSIIVPDWTALDWGDCTITASTQACCISINQVIDIKSFCWITLLFRHLNTWMALAGNATPAQ